MAMNEIVTHPLGDRYTMRKVFFTLFLALTSCICTLAQRPFEGHFFSKELGVNLYINLYEETLTAPGFSFLGKMHGYMKDGIYGTWMITKCHIDGNCAKIRFSNDIGSDTQDVELKIKDDDTYTYHAIGGNAVRKAVGRKLVKVSGDMTFVRVK